MISRTAPLPAGPRRDEVHRVENVRFRVGGRRREPDGAKQREIHDVVPRVGGLRRKEAAPGEDLAPCRHLVLDPLPHDVDPQFPRPDRDHLGGAPRDDPDRHPRALQHLDPVAVPHVEPLRLDPGGVEEDPSVRQHPVHVGEEQADPRRPRRRPLAHHRAAHPTPALRRS